jgi:outer membrane receptor protein involved in Fe transport
VDLSGGFGRNGWNVELYFVNLFDEEGEIDRFVQCNEFICGPQAYAVITPPRSVGLRYSQEF